MRELCQLRPVGVFARCFVGEEFVEGDPVQLPRDLLVEGADADVADALSDHVAMLVCQDKVYNPLAKLSRNEKEHPILTRAAVLPLTSG